MICKKEGWAHPPSPPPGGEACSYPRYMSYTTGLFLPTLAGRWAESALAVVLAHTRTQPRAPHVFSLLGAVSLGISEKISNE